MAAQPIYRDEFNDGISHLYTDITRYMDARFEVLNRQILSDKTETQKRLTNIERDVSNVVAFQQTLMETFKGFATDISKQIAEGFAAQAERHNELMVRVERLERNSNPPTEDN